MDLGAELPCINKCKHSHRTLLTLLNHQPPEHSTLVLQNPRKPYFVSLKSGKKIPWIRRWIITKYMVEGSYNFMQANKFKGFFKDKSQFSRTKIYVINRHSLTPFWSHSWVNHLMESFTIFTSLANVEHTIYIYLTLVSATTLCKMTCTIASEVE